MTDPAAEGRHRAEELLTLLGTDEDGADRLLAGVTEIRDLVFTGAGLTSVARSEARSLPRRSAPRQTPVSCGSATSGTPTAATPPACGSGCAGRPRRSCSSAPSRRSPTR